MALPADFSKIYGSAATGGLTPISDVNYAKGWEFIGATPPTKNDFSYLQNLSDLKSQWLYSNKLQRTDPFGDIKTDGMVDTALENLGLGNLVNALIKTNNLSDLPNKALSRTNLGVPKGVDKQMANEWAVMSGITTVTIGDSLGISSIVRTALGTYVVNLSKPYSSINYAVMGRFIPFDSTDSLAYRGHNLNVTNQTTSSFTLLCPTDYGADYRLRDASELSFSVFGAKP